VGWLTRCEQWLEQNSKVGQTIPQAAGDGFHDRQTTKKRWSAPRDYILRLSTVILSPSILPEIVTFMPAWSTTLSWLVTS